jgi:DNA-binding transcriptional LysR family regulator
MIQICDARKLASVTAVYLLWINIFRSQLLQEFKFDHRQLLTNPKVGDRSSRILDLRNAMASTTPITHRLISKNMKLVDINSELLGEQKQDGAASARNARLYDSRRMRVTLKQWRMLHAVIDCNGFSAAAEYLHVSQSAISYTLARMQEQLGVALLKVEGRKAHVTEEGRTLMEYSRNIIRSAIELETLAEKMRLGWEPELRVVVDQDCPQAFVMAAMRSFGMSAAHVKLTLQEASSATAEQAVLQNTADLAICANVPPGLIADRLLSIQYVAVAHPTHALAVANGPLTDIDLARHTRIVLGTEADSRPQPAAGRPTESAMQWRFSSMDSALAALEAGLGYVGQGSLQLLAMPAHYHNRKDFYLVHARQASPGIGASSLSSLLHSHAAFLAQAHAG